MLTCLNEKAVIEAEITESDVGHDMANTSLSSFSSNSVAYVAGFVIKSVESKANICETCKKCLINSEADSLSTTCRKLIDLRNNGGLQYPSRSCFIICEAAEKALKLFKLEHGEDLNVTAPRFTLMTTVLHSLLPISNSLFPTIKPHLLESELSVDNHFVQLIKLVSNTYITCKLHLYTKQVTLNAKGHLIRHKYTKQIHFQGQ